MNEQAIFTLGEAAKAVRKSKGTISNAISSGRLSVMSKENGRYQIAAGELFRVFSQNGSLNVHNERNETHENANLNSGLHAEAEAKLQVSEAENRLLRDRVRDLERDRDEWRENAKRAQMLLSHTTEQTEKPKKAAEGRFARAWSVLIGKF